jgi:PIF1-like helicase/Helitron helicase-like domain at N-terminus
VLGKCCYVILNRMKISQTELAVSSSERRMATPHARAFKNCFVVIEKDPRVDRMLESGAVSVDLICSKAVVQTAETENVDVSEVEVATSSGSESSVTPAARALKSCRVVIEKDPRVDRMIETGTVTVNLNSAKAVIDTAETENVGISEIEVATSTSESIVTHHADAFENCRVVIRKDPRVDRMIETGTFTVDLSVVNAETDNAGINSADDGNRSVREVIVAQPVPNLPAPPRPRRRAHALIPRRVTYREALLRSEDVENVEEFSLGTLTARCRFCNAIFFEKEQRNRAGDHYICCKYGKVALEPLRECPPELRRLFTSADRDAYEFRLNIRSANSNFAMASFVSKIPEDRNVGQGAVVFTICGQVYHRAESIPPVGDGRLDDPPKFNQLYFLDVNDAFERRVSVIGERIRAETIETLDTMLRRVNPWIRSYVTMGEVIRENSMDVNNICIGFKQQIARDLRNYALPESRSDVAAIFVGDDPPFDVDLKIYPRAFDRLNEIKNLNSLADPMTYPLLFPHGEYGYRTGVRHVGPRATQNRTVTIRQYYSYRIQIRDGFSILHHGNKLFQQYLVDGWVKAEANDMWWIRNNQLKLRYAKSSSIRNRLTRYAEERGLRIGKIVCLPASHLGSPRYLNKQYMEAMAVVARFGKPDLFVTFTANPSWPEIVNNLDHYQKYEHRPDLVARVFKTKFAELLDDFVAKQRFGFVQNYMYVIEFQKRGLPHAHVLFTFREEDRLRDSNAIDAMVTARLPDVETEPSLFEIVSRCYIHRPCGDANPDAPCMKEGKCKSGYPKPFSDVTLADGVLPVVYRRPRDGRTTYVGDVLVDNRRVVPYNRYVAKKFNSHVNVEVCTSLGSIRYLYKYVYKGYDCVSLNVRDGQNFADWDEVKNYLDCRYVSSSEAVWRLFEFYQADRSHSVETLPVHLPGENSIAYTEEDEDALLADAGDPRHVEAVDRLLERRSRLEAYFVLNVESAAARNYRYVQIPEFYTWDGRNGRWNERRQTSKRIGMLAEVSPIDVELFHLRILLSNRSGATSFVDLRTVDGTVHASFFAACVALHLIGDANEYLACLTDVSIYKSSRRLRSFFAMICSVAPEVALPRMGELWERFEDAMIVDLLTAGFDRETSITKGIAEVLIAIRRNLGDQTTLEQLGLRWDADAVNLEIEGRENELRDAEVNAGYLKFQLNVGQREMYEAVFTAVRERAAGRDVQANMFYLDGPAGTGKTFLYNALINDLRKEGHSTAAIAWTGIAATLLIGGRTVHKAFRLSLRLNEDTIAGYPLESPQSEAIKRTSIFIWDEAPMSNKLALHAIDKYLRDLSGNKDKPMGGFIFLLGGDFRQVLPVIKRGHAAAIKAATIKASDLWPRMRQFRLVENLRAAPEEREFAEFLLRVGEGRVPNYRREGEMPQDRAPDDLIELPRRIVVSSLDSLIESTFGSDMSSSSSVFDRVVLCPTNAVVDEVNEIALSRLVGEERVYFSSDTAECDDEDEFYAPIELLNAINSPSLPPHRLRLKIGAVAVVLRNLDVSLGLCNGTRVKILETGQNFIDVEILSGRCAGERHLLPRISIRAEDTALPYPINRHQFPVRLAYAMTINKSQGQTFGKIGICLKTPIFAHGQLYVALSRVRRLSDVRIYVEDRNDQGRLGDSSLGPTFVRNVVYKDLVENVSFEPSSSSFAGEGGGSMLENFFNNFVETSPTDRVGDETSWVGSPRNDRDVSSPRNLSEIQSRLEEEERRRLRPELRLREHRDRVAFDDVPGTSARRSPFMRRGDDVQESSGSESDVDAIPPSHSRIAAARRRNPQIIIGD